MTRRLPLPWRRALLAALPVLAVLPSCDTTTSAPVLATLTLVADRTAVTVTPSAAEGFTWHAAFTATLRETGGRLGVDIATLATRVLEAPGGVVTAVIGTAQQQVTPASNHVDPMGESAIAVGVDYTLPAGGREAVIDFVVTMLDTNGIQYTRTVRVTAS